MPGGIIGRCRAAVVGVMNLLGNAFKFTQQGRISLQVKPVKARDGAAEDAVIFHTRFRHWNRRSPNAAVI